MKNCKNRPVLAPRPPVPGI